MKNIVELSSKNKIKRVVFASAWGVGETKKALPGWFRWLVDHSSLGYQYYDHERQEEVVKKSSLDWTAVRPVFLTNSVHQKEIVTIIDNESKPHLYISRRNLAAFILRVLEKNLYLCQAVVVSENN